jgi:hypothetical protein
MVVQDIRNRGTTTLRGRSLCLNLDWKVVVKYTYREANKVSDALTNYGCTLNLRYLCFADCLNNFRHVLLVDVM